MQVYNVNDWYWQVGGDTTEVWSSSRFAYVPVNDAFFQQWLSNGNSLVQIDGIKSLMQVMASQRIPNYLGGGLAIISQSKDTLNATYALDSASILQLGILARDVSSGFQLPLVANLVQYPDINANPISCSPEDIENIYTAARDYIAGINLAVSTLISGAAATLPSQPVTIA
jgi:hypothetical protein